MKTISASHKFYFVIMSLLLVSTAMQAVASIFKSIERLINFNEIFAGDAAIEDIDFIIRRELIAANYSMFLSNPFDYGTNMFNGGSNPVRLVSINGCSPFVNNNAAGLLLEFEILVVLLFVAIVGMTLQLGHLNLKVSPYRNRARVVVVLVVNCPVAGVGGKWFATYSVNIVFSDFGLIAGARVPGCSHQYAVNNG